MNHIVVTPFILAVAAVATELSPETHVSLGSSITVGVVVIGGAFWVGRYMQEVNDRLKSVEARLKAIERQQTNDL